MRFLLIILSFALAGGCVAEQYQMERLGLSDNGLEIHSDDTGVYLQADDRSLLLENAVDGVVLPYTYTFDDTANELVVLISKLSEPPNVIIIDTKAFSIIKSFSIWPTCCTENHSWPAPWQAEIAYDSKLGQLAIVADIHESTCINNSGFEADDIRLHGVRVLMLYDVSTARQIDMQPLYTAEDKYWLASSYGVMFASGNTAIIVSGSYGEQNILSECLGPHFLTTKGVVLAYRVNALGLDEEAVYYDLPASVLQKELDWLYSPAGISYLNENGVEKI
ncbi:hypothetical protein STSP2_02512 [Anaerohalosphaera lusitana]|uniref:Uncharacterized protein n=1 Tax=Anaerohalosphaera lusitana TaxID=1936003 RepID=A0A1U9NN39_9BACT|nr:hypothetical protein [Anaerohalosphaera lusitana]AQT69323.1 hypothetical protein STSP2_02512 [Anaerohalosphaera lusitana]